MSTVIVRRFDSPAQDLFGSSLPLSNSVSTPTWGQLVSFAIGSRYAQEDQALSWDEGIRRGALAQKALTKGPISLSPAEYEEIKKYMARMYAPAVLQAFVPILEEDQDSGCNGDIPPSLPPSRTAHRPAGPSGPRLHTEDLDRNHQHNQGIRQDLAEFRAKHGVETEPRV